jgi:hypothetical protein
MLRYYTESAASLEVISRITEVDDSSLFCEFVVPRRLGGVQ